MTDVPTTDRYRGCDQPTCSHDLAAGVLIADLLASDGPYPTHIGGRRRRGMPSPDPRDHRRAA